MKEEIPPIVILSASTQPFLSIGVKFGGIVFKNKKYKYIAEHDAFVRIDYNKEIKKHKTWEDFIKYVQSIKQSDQ